MFYKRNDSMELEVDLFKNPSKEYRAAPFWAWNCELDKNELLRQIECLKEMGYGGFHIHTRSGMATKYLSEEFFALVKSCVKKAENENMLVWIYDEDRWPSGSAGGYVTENVRFRQKKLVLTVHKRDDAVEKTIAVDSGKPYLAGIYDVALNDDGTLKSYKLVSEEKEARSVVWYAYVLTAEPTGWHNGNTYIDTLSPEPVESFVQITHEAYKREIGEKFGDTIPAVFTDEPQFAIKEVLAFPESREDTAIPWTSNFDKSFFEKYGLSIIDKLPEIFWELPEGKKSRARYCYHDHISTLFTTSFCGVYSKWCKENGIYLTGHMLAEDTLKWQTAGSGEVMRAYNYFDIPGIDMLCNRAEYTAAKQTQSMVRQHGKEGFMSELYGVTGWDFDFRGHKYQGDWQAALGVTVRVPHLSWVSMKGSAKRDYPASFNYQVPWYREYSLIENHFARLATALTRGKPCVNVGVIHPIESYWLCWGPGSATSDERVQMESDFENITKWLTFGLIDFDFISEACLPEQCGKITNELCVGKMKYSAVIVPPCCTLRSSTIEILDKFIDNGGKVIFTGDCPEYTDAIKSTDAEKVYKKALHIPFEKRKILKSLEQERDIQIRTLDGEATDRLLYQKRKDGNDCWIFIANGTRIEEKDIRASYLNTPKPIESIIKIKGEFTPVKYDTLSGEISRIAYSIEDGFTVIPYDFYLNDSLLLRLKTFDGKIVKKSSSTRKIVSVTDFKNSVRVKREEDNVCLLDIAEYSFGEEEFFNAEEILRIDKKLRKELNWPMANGRDVQPWAIEKEEISHYVTLRFKVVCNDEIYNTYFCAEELETLVLNGEAVEIKEKGYFVDKSIKKYMLPVLRKGENTIEEKVPFGKRISLEPCYLTGDFDVYLRGCEKILASPSEYAGFGDITCQGMPFYGGNLIYQTEIDLSEKADIVVNTALYAGALVKVSLDGEENRPVVFEPYETEFKGVKAGRHTLDFTLYGNRYNTFSPLHYCGKCSWHSQNHWYSEGSAWCYEYNLKKTGILKSPVVTCYICD